MIRFFSIVVSVLMCASAFSQESKFPALMLWSAWLSDVSTKWNLVCGDTPDTPGCSEAREILNQQYVMFIEAAKRYTTSGIDCKSILRPKCIQYEIDLAGFNINCGGKPLTDSCTKSSQDLHSRELDLKTQMKTCLEVKL